MTMVNLALIELECHGMPYGNQLGAKAKTAVFPPFRSLHCGRERKINTFLEIFGPKNKHQPNLRETVVTKSSRRYPEDGRWKNGLEIVELLLPKGF